MEIWRKGCALERGMVKVHLHGDMKERVCSRKRNGQGSFAWRCEGKGLLSKEEWSRFICMEMWRKGFQVFGVVSAYHMSWMQYHCSRNSKGWDVKLKEKRVTATKARPGHPLSGIPSNPVYSAADEQMLRQILAIWWPLNGEGYIRTKAKFIKSHVFMTLITFDVNTRRGFIK